MRTEPLGRDILVDIEAVAVLPEHLHAIWTLPIGDADYALRWRLIKTIFSRSIPAVERRSASRQENGESDETTSHPTSV